MSKPGQEAIRPTGCRALLPVDELCSTSWYKASGHDLLTTARLLRHANVANTQIYALLDPTRPAQVVAGVHLPFVA